MRVFDALWRASKDDGPNASAHPSRAASRPPQDDGKQSSNPVLAAHFASELLFTPQENAPDGRERCVCSPRMIPEKWCPVFGQGSCATKEGRRGAERRTKSSGRARRTARSGPG